MKPILEIKNISKLFKIQGRESYASLRDSLANVLKKSEPKQDFWALKDVTFDVMPGESIGIIGKNGAGKSTLLKILSRITPPTSGRIISRGRIASLLEVGTGFHPELTGRENIYLNGSILGLSKKEIDRRFDEIVEFAGTGKFLDTTLKHYSSGMQLRLAFSVAAFLEPEVLVIDEVLAVGDAEFQRKCLGKMEDVSKSGRTVIFVSHNMAAIENLCKTTILLKEGTVDSIGPSSQITQAYLKSPSQTHNNENPADQFFLKTSKASEVTRLEFLSGGIHTETVYMGGDLEIRMHYLTSTPLENPLMGLVVYDAVGAPVMFFNNKNYGIYFGVRSFDEAVIKLHIDRLNLMPGFYTVDIYFANALEDLDVKKSVFTFQVIYKHFIDAGEPLLEKYNRIFFKDVSWGIKEKNK